MFVWEIFAALQRQKLYFNIFVMNSNSMCALMRRAEAEFGSLRAKIALMSEHDPHYTQQELPDPYYGEADGFERVLDQCESSSRAWVKVLQQQFELKV